MNNILNFLAIAMTWIIGLTIAIGPWIYHLVYCFQTEKYLLLIAGAIVPPVGWFHGLGAVFGWW